MNTETMQLIELQGEIKVALIKAGVPEAAAHEAAAEALHLVAISPVAGEAYRSAYEPVPDLQDGAEAEEWGSFVFECPTCREVGYVSKSQGLVTLTTDDAESIEQIPGGLRWMGVKCEVCGDYFTVEAVDEEVTAGPP